MTKIDFSQAARNNRKSNKPPRSKLQGIEKRSDDFSQGVTPECFNRGPPRNSRGFPLKACGNDGLWELTTTSTTIVRIQAARIAPKRLKTRRVRFPAPFPRSGAVELFRLI